MAVYPTIREETIMTMNIVAMSLAQDPEYLDRKECPYSPMIKQFFKNKIEVQAPAINDEGEFDLFQGDDEMLVLDQQIIKVINDLEKFGTQLGTADTAEKMAYFRTKTSLIDKLVSMRERIFNLKEISDFKTRVMSFMNEVLNKDQITQFMRKMDGALGVKNDDLR